MTKTAHFSVILPFCNSEKIRLGGGEYIDHVTAGYTMAEGRLQKQYDYMTEHNDAALMGVFFERTDVEGVSTINDAPLQVTVGIYNNNKNIL